MTNHQLLELFNNDPKTFWRVDWYGYLQTADKDGEKYADPYVELYLSKVQSAGNFEFNSKGTTDYRNQLKINVPIEWLCALRIGDLLNRKSVVRTADQNHRIEDFRDVNIHKDNIQHVAAGAKSANGEFYLPTVHHPYHLKATKTRCAIVTLSPTKKLVIPHYVILQTYFSSCSFVFRQLFQQGLSLGSLYDAGASFLEDNGRAFIHLKQRVHDVAAPEIARMAFDMDAQLAALKVSRSVATQTANSEPHLFPTTQFPFTGHTNLKVYGKWCGTESLRTFVVFGILECTSAFPFTTLHYFRDAPGDKDKSSPSESSKQNGTEHYPKHRKKPPVPGDKFSPEHTETPDSELLNMDIEVKSRTIHQGLEEVKKLRIAPHKSINGSRPPLGVEEVSQGNAGEGKLNGMGAPLVFVTESDSETKKWVFGSKVDRLKMFDEICLALRSKARVESLEYKLSKPQFIDNYARFPHAKNSNGIKLTWPYSNYIKGVRLRKNEKLILRKVAIAELELPTCTAYLFEAERRIQAHPDGWIELDQPALLFVKSTSKKKLSNFQLERILQVSAENRGVWQDKAPEGFKCASIKHPANDTIEKGTYTNKFIEILQNELGHDFDK